MLPTNENFGGLHQFTDAGAAMLVNTSKLLIKASDDLTAIK